jgi:fructose-bisphosphate aldolase, class II
MPLTSTADIVAAAYGAGRGALACNIVTLEYAEAIVAGAARAGLPVILQISHNCVDYHGGLEPLAIGALALARSAPGPVAVHLDHARTAELVAEAIELGVRSVMFDASELDDDQNVARTREVTAECHRRGTWVEAELGEVGGKDGVHSATARTDPAAAARYVEMTGVDALAVAVGSSHARPARDAALDLELIGRLRAAVPRPLVLHGSSGVPDTGLVSAVQAGLTKINIATQFSKLFTAAVRESLDADPSVVDPRRYLGAGRDAMAAEVERLLRLVAEARRPG